MNIREHQDHFWVDFDNGVSVEVIRDGRSYGGIGRVKCGRRDLRCAELPIQSLIETVNGYRVRHLEVRDLKQGRDDLTLVLRPYMVVNGRTQERSADGEDRWNVGPWSPEPVRDRGGTAWLRLREVNHYVNGIELRGFSYAYSLRSRKYRSTRIHDRATWELDGRATGKTLLMRGHARTPCKKIASRKSSFTTALLRDGLDSQFRPLFSDLQGFTFQFDRRAILVTAFERPFACVSLLHKEPALNYIIHWHQLCGALPRRGTCLDFPALEVMCAEVAAGDEAERMDQYDAVRRDVHERHRRALGLSPDRTVCALGIVSAECHRKGDIERGVNELARADCAEVMVEGLLHPRRARADAEEREGKRRDKLLVRTTPAERKRIADVVDLARSRGMEVATGLSSLLPLPATQPGAVPTQGIGPICGVCAGEGRFDGLLDEIRKKFSFDAIYLDGRTADTRLAHGRPCSECTPEQHFRALVAFHRSGQRHGYRCAMGGGGPLGLSASPLPYAAVRNREAMYRDTVMPFPAEQVAQLEEDPKAAYFRGYANRLCYWVCFGDRGSDGPAVEPWWNGEYAAVNKAFNLVRDNMVIPRLLEQGRGVLWSGTAGEEDVSVLWAYSAFGWLVGAEASVYDVMAGRAVRVKDAAFDVEPLRVYLVQDALPP